MCLPRSGSCDDLPMATDASCNRLGLSGPRKVTLAHVQGQSLRAGIIIWEWGLPSRAALCQTGWASRVSLRRSPLRILLSVGWMGQTLQKASLWILGICCSYIILAKRCRLLRVSQDSMQKGKGRRQPLGQKFYTPRRPRTYANSLKRCLCLQGKPGI